MSRAAVFDAVLCGVFPPSTNALYIHRGRSKARALAPRYREFLDLAVPLLIQVSRGAPPIGGHLEAQIEYWPPDQRRRDSDNYVKAVFDALEAARIVRDDRQIRDFSVRWHDRLTDWMPTGGIRITLFDREGDPLT